MKNTNRSLMIAVLSFVALPLMACGGDVHSQLQGHWLSAGCETRPAPNNGHLYLKRDMTFQASSWAGDFSFFTDDTCGTLTSVAHVEGPYSLGEPWSAVAGSYQGRFDEVTVKVTPKAQAMAEYLNTAEPGTCGTQTWQVGVQQDITPTHGCPLLGLDLQSCGSEYELVKIEDDKLYFGARPADGSSLCTPDKRPTAAQVPMVRQAQ